MYKCFKFPGFVLCNCAAGSEESTHMRPFQGKPPLGPIPFPWQNKQSLFIHLPVDGHLILSTFQFLLTVLLWIVMYKFVIACFQFLSYVFWSRVTEYSRIFFLRKCQTILYKVFNILHLWKKWSIVLIFVCGHKNFPVLLSHYCLCSVWEGGWCREVATERLWYMYIFYHFYECLLIRRDYSRFLKI